MSMVYVKNHNENIYDTEQEKKNTMEMVEQKMYTSKFKSKIQTEVGTKKGTHKTMGYAQTPLALPTNYLKKNDGIRWRSAADHKCFKKELPPVPRHGEIAVRSAPVQDKNLRIENIKKVVRLTPTRPRPKYVDTRHGVVHDLFSSGLMPQYIFRPSYGKVPHYLYGHPRKNEQNVQQVRGNEAAQHGRGDGPGPGQTGQDDLKYISQEERFALLDGLKANWEKLQKKYQGLPVMTDTQPKRIAKANLEKELKQLEQDIMLIESNPHIYVCDNAQR